MTDPVHGPMMARLDDPPIARLDRYRALFQDAPDGWLLRDISRQKQFEAEHEQLLWELLRRRRPGTPSDPLLPLCAKCQRVRRGEGTWTDLPAYLAVHFDLQFTHGVCPDCRRQF